MKWSWLVGKPWGTEIRLHASLVLLIPYTLIVFQPEDLFEVMWGLGLVGAIFVCVAFHELGHTLAARWYGIKVTSIVLWPLGGFANLSRRPEKALSVMVISAAGPLVNMLISSVLLALIVLERLVEYSATFPVLARFLWSVNGSSFLIGLAVANLSLAVFNLVPVYPLDGGQIARGLLKLVTGEKWADRIMLVISLPLALALTVYGFFSGDIIIILTGLLLVVAGSTLNMRLSHALRLAWMYIFDLGGYYLQRSDFDLALQEYNRVIKITPDQPGLYVSRAITYMNLLAFTHAREDIERAIALDDANSVAWALLSELHSLEKDYPQALAAINRAIEIRPNWYMAYLDRAGIYQEQGSWDLAQADMNYTINQAHESASNFLHRSILRYQLGDQKGAWSDADQALRHAPHWMLAFPEIFVLGLKGTLNWALDYYGRAIERLPNAYQAYQGRADACRINDRLDWAIMDYERAIRLAPRQGELYLSRGRCFLQMGHSERAAADFQQAIKLADRSHIRRQARELLCQAQPPVEGEPGAVR